MKPSIAAVDDHRIVVDGLKCLIESKGEWSVSTFHSGVDALTAWEAASFDLMIVDLRMPDMSGIELVRHLRRLGQAVPVVVLTCAISDYELAEAMALQVAGIVLKDDTTSALVDCIGAVLRGQTYLEDSRVVEGLARLDQSNSNATAAVSKLTSRELEIATLAADGWRTKEIGARLGIAAGTVKVHLHAIYTKLGLDTRVGLANFMRAAAPTR